MAKEENDIPGVVRVQHRPLSFSAMQWNGENTLEIGRWIKATVEVVQYHYQTIATSGDYKGPYLRIYKGERDIRIGEWIVRDGFDYRILNEIEFETEFMPVAS